MNRVAKLSHGNGNTCDVIGAEVVEVRPQSTGTIAEQDIPAQVQQVFSEPLDYPDLASATVPGDTVAVALEYDTPQLLAVLAGTRAALERAGVETAALTVLLSAEFASAPAIVAAIYDLLGSEATIIVHECDQDKQLAMLGVTAAGRPLRLNRALCDADVVIPIGPARSSASERVTMGMLFPNFSDHETIARFNTPVSHQDSTARQKLAEEIRECDWMLGVGLALQVVPGPRGGIAQLCCGTPGGATLAANAAYRQVWSAGVAAKADLIVAKIVGDEAQQTWQNLGQALARADELLEPGGAIAICSEIAVRPGPAGKRLRNAQDLEQLERKLLGGTFADSAAALQLCRMLQRGTIYLQSRLSAAYVESLGLAPLDSHQQLNHLISSYRRCLVLDEAQYLEPELMETSVRKQIS